MHSACVSQVISNRLSILARISSPFTQLPYLPSSMCLSESSLRDEPGKGNTWGQRGGEVADEGHPFLGVTNSLEKERERKWSRLFNTRLGWRGASDFRVARVRRGAGGQAVITLHKAEVIELGETQSGHLWGDGQANLGEKQVGGHKRRRKGLTMIFHLVCFGQGFAGLMRWEIFIGIGLDLRTSFWLDE